MEIISIQKVTRIFHSTVLHFTENIDDHTSVASECHYLQSDCSLLQWSVTVCGPAPLVWVVVVKTVRYSHSWLTVIPNLVVLHQNCARVHTIQTIHLSSIAPQWWPMDEIAHPNLAPVAIRYGFAPK